MIQNIFFIIAVLFFFFSAFMLYSLWKQKELALPEGELHFPKKIGILSIIAAIILYVVANIVAGILFRLFAGNASGHLTQEEYYMVIMPLGNALSILFFLGFIRARGREVWTLILGARSNWHEKLSFIYKGILYAVSCFSLVTFISLALELLISIFGEFPEGEQYAFLILKQLFATPWPFAITAFTFIFLVPAVEEFFFRGFLQTYFVGKWGAKIGILTTSVLFAFSHFSSGQKFTNIPIIASIFALSYVIGVAYERKRSLLIPISIHVTNNAIYMISTTIELSFMQ